MARLDRSSSEPVGLSADLSLLRLRAVSVLFAESCCFSHADDCLFCYCCISFVLGGFGDLHCRFSQCAGECLVLIEL